MTRLSLFNHPLLLGFDLVLLVVIALLVFVPLRRGVQTAVDESTVKFQAAAWLEEVARNPRLFKTGGAQRWALDIADRIVAVLDEAQLTLAGHSLVDLRFVALVTRREQNGRLARADVRFRATTEQA